MGSTQAPKQRPPHPFVFGFPMFLFAFVQFSIGPTVPTVASLFGVSETDLGIAFAFQFSGALTMLLLGGSLVSRYGHRANLLASTLLFVAAVANIPFVQSVWHLCVVLFFMGAASANAQVIIFALVELVYGETASRNQSLVTFGFALGAVIGPLFTGATTTSIGWASVFWTGLILGVPGLWPLFSARLSVSPSEQPEPDAKGGYAWFWALTLALISYLGSEAIVNSWLSTYFKEWLHATPLWQGLGLSIFWVGVACGRLAGSRFAHRVPLIRLLAVYAIGGAAAFSLALRAGTVLSGTLLFGLTGAFYAGIIPALISLLAKEPGGTGLMHLYFAFGQIGPILFPYLSGLVADRVGFHRAFLIPAPLLLVALLFTLLFGRLRPSPPTAKYRVG